MLATVVTGTALWASATATAAAAKSWVALTPDTITVSDPGARAVITRDPYRLVIERRGGGAALSEVANHGAHPQRLLPTLDPRSPGLPNPVPTTL